MSRLYSSPEGYAVAVVASLKTRAHAGAPNHDAAQFHVVDFANQRVQQRRVPQPPAFTADRTKSFNLPKLA